MKLKKHIAITLAIILFVSLVPSSNFSEAMTEAQFFTYVKSQDQETSTWNNHKANLSTYVRYNEIVYGSHSDITPNDLASASDTETGLTEYRYLGYASDGNTKVLNNKHPVDGDINKIPSPTTWDFVKVNGEASWNAVGNTTLRSYLYNKNLVNPTYNITEASNFSPKYIDNRGISQHGGTTYDYVRLQTVPSWFSDGTVYVNRRTSNGVFYGTFVSTAFGVGTELNGSVNAPSTVTIGADSDSVSFNVGVTSNIALKGFARAEDIIDYTIKLRGSQKVVQKSNSNSLTVSNTLNRSNVKDGDVITFEATVSYETLYGDSVTMTFSDETIVVVKIPPDPYIYLSASVSPSKIEYADVAVPVVVTANSTVYGLSSSDISRIDIDVEGQIQTVYNSYKTGDKYFSFTIPTSDVDSSDGVKKWYNVVAIAYRKNGSTLRTSELLVVDVYTDSIHAPPIVNVSGHSEVYAYDRNTYNVTARSPVGRSIDGYLVDTDGVSDWTYPRSYAHIYWTSTGEKYVLGNATDSAGDTGIAAKTITVLAPTTNSIIDTYGKYKVNRIIDVIDSSDTPSETVINDNARIWGIDTPIVYGTKDYVNANSTFKFAPKTNGNVTFSLYSENNRGYGDTDTRTIKIASDIPPIADFNTEPIKYRDPNNGKIATFNITNTSFSTDYDELDRTVLKFRFDSDNDGSFTDEAWIEDYDSSYRKTFVLNFSSVGKYEIYLAQYETFEVLNGLTSSADYLSASTTKSVEVANKAPQVGQNIKEKESLSIDFSLGDFDGLTRNDLDAYIQSDLIPSLDDEGYTLTNYSINEEPIETTLVKSNTNIIKNSQVNIDKVPIAGLRFVGGNVFGLEKIYNRTRWKLSSRSYYYDIYRMFMIEGTTGEVTVFPNQFYTASKYTSRFAFSVGETENNYVVLTNGYPLNDIPTASYQIFHNSGAYERTYIIDKASLSIQSNNLWKSGGGAYFHEAYGDKLTMVKGSDFKIIDASTGNYPYGINGWCLYGDSTRTSNTYDTYVDYYQNADALVKNSFSIKADSTLQTFYGSYSGSNGFIERLPNAVADTYWRTNTDVRDYMTGVTLAVPYQNSTVALSDTITNAKGFVEKTGVSENGVNYSVFTYNGVDLWKTNNGVSGELTPYTESRNFYIGGLSTLPSQQLMTNDSIFMTNFYDEDDDDSYDSYDCSYFEMGSTFLENSKYIQSNYFVRLDNDSASLLDDSNSKTTFLKALNNNSTDFYYISASANASYDYFTSRTNGFYTSSLANFKAKLISQIKVDIPISSTPLSTNDGGTLVGLLNTNLTTTSTFSYDFENDPNIEEILNIVHVDPHYSDASNGTFPTTTLNKGTSVNLNKYGRYKITHKVRDYPKADARFSNYWLWSNEELFYVLIHHLPIASFTIDKAYLDGVAITDSSYDPDHQVSDPINKGIVERFYQYREKGTATWINGLPVNLTFGKVYQIQERVQDIEEAYSTWITRECTPLNMKMPVTILDAKAKTVSTSFSLNSIPSSESISIYDILTKFQKAHYIKGSIVGKVSSGNITSGTSNADGSTSWSNINLNIPSSVADGNYTIRLYAYDSSDVSNVSTKDFPLVVYTPINLVPTVPSIFEDGINNLTATTSKYVTSLNATLYKGSAFQVTVPMTYVNTVGNKKTWKYNYTQADTVDGGNYNAEFVATTASGKKETVIKPYSVKFRLVIQSIDIWGEWNHWRGQVDLFGISLPNMPHRFMSYEMVHVDATIFGEPDYVDIRFSPGLEAMQFVDINGNTYEYFDQIGYTVSFPLNLTTSDNSFYTVAYVLPLATTSLDNNNIRIRNQYSVTVTAHKGAITDSVIINDIDITGNILDKMYSQSE
jgi:hypothetical protein